MQAIYRSLTILLNIIELFILIRIILSWLPISRQNPIIGFVYEMTEPILGPCRELLFRIGLNRGMIDFSPIVAALFLRILRALLFRIIY